MSTLHAIGLRLAAVCVLLGAPAAHGKLYLDGPDKWYPGQTITIRLFADADTRVQSFGFGIDTVTFEDVYPAFAQVLELLDVPTVAEFIRNEGGFCTPTELGCTYSYPEPPLLIPQGTVITWEFWVRDDARIGPLEFAFDLKAEALTDPLYGLPDPITWIAPKEFEVLALPIPESSSWILMIAGLLALGAYGRRPA